MIIDNSFYAFAYQLDNGIPISSWFDDKKDEELMNMIPLLQAIRTRRDVRPFLRSKYKLREKVNRFTLPFSIVSNKNKRLNRTIRIWVCAPAEGDKSRCISHRVRLCIPSS